MRILLLTPEHPAQKYGATSPVGRDVEALAQAYRRAGHDVRVSVPVYSPLDDPEWKCLANVRVSFLRLDEAAVLGGHPKWPHVRLISHPILERDHPYLDAGGWDHPDNALRFALFCASALVDCSAENWMPDLIHAHEWQTGLAMLYASEHFKGIFPDTKRLFSFQDAAFQGLCDLSWASQIGLGPEWTRSEGLEF